ncbi:MAG: NAD-dependent epimerase/dehydratase family protein [Gemmatimonadetes bacterium]|nr:NAD-dependent epimerase/dehydratase family protein [Gemmatimonadota bacterium]
MKRILVSGAAGQIGSELVPALRARYGAATVIATDIRDAHDALGKDGIFEVVDSTDAAALDKTVQRHGIDAIYHLAAILSATAEYSPQRAYRINLGGLFNVLEVAREHGCAVFTPSSIAAFGPSTPRDGTPQDTVQRPTSIYGITKVAGELLCDYYFTRFGVDTRGLRYPGLISHTARPGGGTTDYAVEIFYHALQYGRYTCFLAADTQLDLMYMPDAIRAAIELMEAEPARLRHRNAFNIAAFQATPAALAEAIRRHLPEFEIRYEIDPVRQRIADSWPRRVDDAAAREEWGWRAAYDLEATVADMLRSLAPKLGPPSPVPAGGT